MTNQKAIELIRCAQAKIEWEQSMEYAAAFDKAIEALEAAPAKWISVKKRPPKKAGEYIVCTIDEVGEQFVTSDLWLSLLRCWYLYDEHADSIVTHWMPMPKPPKSET